MASTNRPQYSKFNWPAHCEGKRAAHNGESHHNNPYDPDFQPKDFKRWNDGYNYVVQILLQNNHLEVTQ